MWKRRKIKTGWASLHRTRGSGPIKEGKKGRGEAWTNHVTGEGRPRPAGGGSWEKALGHGLTAELHLHLGPVDFLFPFCSIFKFDPAIDLT